MALRVQTGNADRELLDMSGKKNASLIVAQIIITKSTETINKYVKKMIKPQNLGGIVPGLVAIFTVGTALVCLFCKPQSRFPLK